MSQVRSLIRLMKKLSLVDKTNNVNTNKNNNINTTTDTNNSNHKTYNIRKRKVRTAKSLSDIFQENQIMVTREMKDDIDIYVKENFSLSPGIIDENELANKVFTSVYYDLHDEGHLRVLGFIINKYCIVSNKYIKKTLLKIRQNYTSEEEYRKILRLYLGVILFKRSGKIFFRKTLKSI